MMAADPITAALDIGGKVIDRLWPDPVQRDAAKLELFKLQQSGELAMVTSQTEINKVEAASDNVFVAGWRPFIGWVCGMSYAWNWIGLPVALFITSAIGHPVDVKPADLSEMSPILMGMLGLGALRSFDKFQARKTS